ncbi:MAG: polysaccharide pyruvyl transferase CsaB [Tindallia sp. MSAO_Bac2]|nr:MAG: polysaccharide pyruvyl transferase CsaB [Tindallia sp. MSAO_Bac2]
MKYFVLGYFGFDNLGDELLLKQTIQIIHKVDPDCEITSLSYSQTNTEDLHGIHAVSRNDFMGLFETMFKSDVVIGGGGSILQNVTSNRSIIYYITILLCAKAMRKKVVMMGNGIGPIKGAFYQKATSYLLRKVDLFLARDEDTMDEVVNRGAKNPVLAADLVYYGYQKKNKQKSKTVLINIRPWHLDERFHSSMKSFLKKIEEKGYNIALVSMQKGHDDIELKKLGDYTFLDVTMQNYLNSDAEYYCMIGMRLHALIWAGIRDTPFLSISYDPKIDSFTKISGQINAGPVHKINENLLLSNFETLEIEYEERERALKQANQRISQLALENEKQLKRLIEQ